MFKWQEKCSERASIHFDSNPYQRAEEEINQELYREHFENSGMYMFSEVTYPDEFDDIGRPQLGECRGVPSYFFEITTYSGKLRYRSASSEAEIFKKYKDIRILRHITQQEYAKLRAHSVSINEDDLQ